MKYTITTYDDNGKEIVSRDYIFGGVIGGGSLERILSDSLEYMEEANKPDSIDGLSGREEQEALEACEKEI